MGALYREIAWPVARRGVLVIWLVLLAPCLPQAASAVSSEAEVSTYLEAHRKTLERRLADYNRAHRLVVHSNAQWTLKIFDWEVIALEGERVFTNISFQVGRSNWSPAPGAALFELALTDGGPEILSHQPFQKASPGTKALPPSLEGAQPATAVAARSQQETESYISDHLRDLQRKLGTYNKKVRIAVHRDSQWEVKIAKWRIERLQGDRVFAAINFNLGRWSPAAGAALFELQWQGEALEIVGHGPMPKSVASGSRVLGYDDEAGCVYNYYAARPCLDTLRRWREFTEFHDLEMTPETATIFQAYKHHDVETGNRLMARARGLPVPSGESVFGLQREVTAMSLGRFQRNPKNPCDLNPYGVRPCPEIFKAYRAFIASHGLPDDQRSAAMLESYADGDFRRADVIYALAKGLNVPAYGYIPSGLARDVATLNLGRFQNPRNPCDLTPYGPRPCLEVVSLWRDFAARYGLEDRAGHARVFQAYAEGDYRAADQLFAQAKGVSLEQFLEASGVPTEGLVIEVYPGRKQLLLRGVTGS